jgi:hypothetical protein
VAIQWTPIAGALAVIVSIVWSAISRQVTNVICARNGGYQMAENWTADVKKYVPNANEKAIASIVKYCGIALQKRDSSLVSFTDKEEVARVRNNFLKKKLGLTNSDAELDKTIMLVGDKMKGDRTKNRVTVYYLLAEHFGKLSMFS